MFWRVPSDNETIYDSSSAQEHYENLLSKPLGIHHLIERAYYNDYGDSGVSEEDKAYYNDRMLSNALSTPEDIEEYFNAIATSNYGVGTYPSVSFRDKWPVFKEYLDNHTTVNEYGDIDVVTDAGKRTGLRSLSKELNEIYCQVHRDDIKEKLIEVSQETPEGNTLKNIERGFYPNEENIIYFLHNMLKFPELNLEESNMYRHLKLLTDAALSELLTITYDDVVITGAAWDDDNPNPMHYANVIRRITDTLQGIHGYAALYLNDKNLPTLVFQHLYNFIPHGTMDAKKKEMLDMWMNNLQYVFDFLQRVIAFDKTSSKDDSMDYNSERGQFLERWSPDDELGGALDSAQFQDSMYQDYFTAPDIRSDIDKEVMEFSYEPPLGIQSALRLTADPLTYTNRSDFDRDDNYTNQAEFVNSTNIDGTEMRDGFWGETDWRYFNPTDVFDTIDDSNDYAAQPVLASASKDEVFIYLKAPNSIREQFNHIAKLEDELHVTLLFLKKLKLNGHSHERLLKELSIVAKAYTSITCKSNGAAVFNDEDNSHVMLVNAKNISKLHNDLKDAVAAAHSNINSKYDFIPHMTLRSNSNGKVDVGKIPEVSWNNRSFFVKLGDESEYRIAFGTGKVTEIDAVIEKLSWYDDEYGHDTFHEYDDVDDYDIYKKQHHHEFIPIQELRSPKDSEEPMPDSNREYLQDDNDIDINEAYSVVRLPNGEVRYYDYEDQLHRTDGPAVTARDGSIHWYMHGVSHRTDGPASIGRHGTQTYRINGELHRDNDLPAVIWSDGSKFWYRNGDLHREDGPAETHPDGRSEWYINGKRDYSKLSNLKFNLDNMSKFSKFSSSSNYDKESDNGKLKTFSEDTWSEGQEEAEETHRDIEEVSQVNQEPKQQIIYPDVNDILDLHDDIILQYGGTPGVNELTEGKLEAAIGRMQSGFGEEEFFKSVLDKAAVLIHSIVSTHPFTDGNKRTGMMSGIDFMDENGYTMDDSEHLADTIVSLSTSETSLEQMIAYMNKHAYQIIASNIEDNYGDTMQSLSWKDIHRDIHHEIFDYDKPMNLTYENYISEIERFLNKNVTFEEAESTKDIDKYNESDEEYYARWDAYTEHVEEYVQMIVDDNDLAPFEEATYRNVLGDFKLFVENPIESSLKFAGFDDATNPNDVGPKEEVKYDPAEKRENEGIVRNRFHNEEAELIYEVGLHQDMNRPETNRPVTPYASKSSVLYSNRMVWL